MLSGCSITAPTDRADHKGNLRLATEHVAEFRALIQKLVEADTHKSDEHHLGDRAQACHGGTDSGTDKARFADGSVENTFTPKLFHQTFSDSEHATPGIITMKVL